MIVTVKNGEDISQKLALEIKSLQAKAFGSSAIDKKKKYSFEHAICFLLRNEKGKLVSVGIIREKKMKYLGKVYKIMSIGGVASNPKGKGYGKIIMQAIVKYLKNNKLTGLGFCKKSNSPFYKKSGLEIADNVENRFCAVEQDNLYNNNCDALYVSGKDKFMEKVQAHKRAKVYLKRFF